MVIDKMKNIKIIIKIIEQYIKLIQNREIIYKKHIQKHICIYVYKYVYKHLYKCLLIFINMYK